MSDPRPSLDPWSAEAEPGDSFSETDSRRRWLFLTPGDVFLDVGACLGSWSFPALEMGATVHAIDESVSPVVLAKHIAGRPYAVNYNVLEGRVGDGEPDARIDSLGLGRIDFVKVDVEGAELRVLRGMAETIQKYRPRLVIEVHTKAVSPGVQVAEVTGLLDSLAPGYRYEAVERQEGWYWHLYCDPGVLSGVPTPE